MYILDANEHMAVSKLNDPPSYTFIEELKKAPHCRFCDTADGVIKHSASRELLLLQCEETRSSRAALTSQPIL